MTPPPMLMDIVRMLLALAAPAALLCLVLAGVSIRQSGGASFAMSGSFPRWMLWSVIFLTLPQLLAWFPTFGVPATLPVGGIGTGWMASVVTDVTRFVTEFVATRLAAVLAAFFVLKAVLDVANGANALPSVLAAMFLLSVASTAGLLRSWNSGAPTATADILASLWTYVVSQIMPVAAGLAITGAIWNFWRNRPWMHLAGSAGAFLVVAALWRLVQRMML